MKEIKFKNVGVDGNIFILSNGVDVNLDLGNNLKNSKIKKLIFLGRIHPKKGIEIFLESFNSLSEIEKSSFKITIVGTGKLNYLIQLKNKINFLNLSKYVKILPSVFDARKRLNLLKKFDLFFLTSYEEADSIAVKQAMACGLPVIISEQCRLKDVKKFSCGFIVKTTIVLPSLVTYIFWSAASLNLSNFTNIFFNSHE